MCPESFSRTRRIGGLYDSSDASPGLNRTRASGAFTLSSPSSSSSAHCHTAAVDDGSPSAPHVCATRNLPSAEKQQPTKSPSTGALSVTAVRRRGR